MFEMLDNFLEFEIISIFIQKKKVLHKINLEIVSNFNSVRLFESRNVQKKAQLESPLFPLIF